MRIAASSARQIVRGRQPETFTLSCIVSNVPAGTLIVSKASTLIRPVLENVPVRLPLSPASQLEQISFCESCQATTATQTQIREVYRIVLPFPARPIWQSGCAFRIPNSDGVINVFLYGAICCATVEWFGVFGNRLRPFFTSAEKNESGSGCWYLWRIKYWHAFRLSLGLR